MIGIFMKDAHNLSLVGVEHSSCSDNIQTSELMVVDP